MLCTIVDMQVTQLLCTELGLREHTLDHLDEQRVITGLDRLLERLGHKVCRSERTLTARITRITEIFVLVHLVAVHNDFVGIDDDYIRATIDIGREVCLIFATKKLRNLRAQTTEDLTFGVNDHPLLVDLLRSDGQGLIT